MTDSWPFPDAENTAAFTSKKILNGADWVYHVTHDADDGAWQFHPYGGPTPENEAAVVGLETMLSLDASIQTVADLPLGWHAWRESPTAPWMRSPIEG